MLRSKCCSSLRAALQRRPADAAYFSTSAVSFSHQPNAPLDLDPSFQSLLRDVDMSLLRHKSRHVASEDPHVRVPQELEAFPEEPAVLDADSTEHVDVELSETKDSRKSPAAAFGSRQIGAVILPLELQNSINRLISDSDKSTVHQDAVRLFSRDSVEDESEWATSYDVKYKNRKQKRLHADRDGTAFASVALPSHYSVVYAVLDHIKQRLGPDWQVGRVIDWGSGTGTGLWASSHAFQGSTADSVSQGRRDPELARSTVATYVGIDNRDGLVSIGKRLVRGVELRELNVSWQRSFREENRIERADGGNMLALSAFMLSSLPTPLARRALVKEMWESGAEVIVLIDHNTTAGFECVAESREYLLKCGRKELEDPALDGSIRGSHVIAPCPHDGACPLYQPGSSKLVCSFSQRLQRPEFVRKTKHSRVGYEDSGYSYVVIRRGTRPLPAGTTIGRLGTVGRREVAEALLKQSPKRELRELAVEDTFDSGISASAQSSQSEQPNVLDTLTHTEQDTEASLRSEAYNWPRLVFPPLKRSGHIIIDGCTAEGKIMRMTIPKSQGKQPFYDARKSSWGDIFPHEPKNRPQERFIGPKKAQGEDIGKRRKTHPQAASYGRLSGDLKERNRGERARRRANKSADEQVDAAYL